MNIFWCVILVAVLSGCASVVPAPINKIPAVTVAVADVRMNAERFIDSEVRWGGVITRVENKAEETWVELVSRPLKGNGQPRTDSKNDGRFIASFPGFIDPTEYTPGKMLTVVGIVEGSVTRPIGDFAYSFPIVTVGSSYLWKTGPKIIHHEYYPSPRWHHNSWRYYPRPYYYPRLRPRSHR